jgi:exosortase
MREAALLAFTLGIAVWANFQALADIVGIGVRDTEQSHIFLVPFVAAWLVYLRRSRLRFVPYSPSVVGPAAVIAGWLTSWVGFRFGIEVAWHGGAIVSLVGVLLGMTGLEAVRQFAPAFAVLVFAVPVPGVIRRAIAVPLQEIATSITHGMLDLLGVASVRDGSVLIINGEQVGVGEACNGMRMVFALTLVVYAFAFGTPLRTSSRVLLLALSPIAALACNVVRLVPTSLFFGYASADRAQVFHDLAGWVMLPFALAILLGVLRMFHWLEFPVTTLRLAKQ